MITKLGAELVENAQTDTTASQAMGYGATAAALGSAGAQLSRKALSGPLIRAALAPGKHLTDAESDRLIRNMLGSRKDIIVKTYPHGNIASYFMPHVKTVIAPRNSYFLAHELGHATGLLGKNRILGQMAGSLTHGVGGYKFAPVITSISSAHKAHNRELGLPESEDSATLSCLNTAAQIGTAGQLMEEAQASIRGLNAIGKIQGRTGILRASRVLGPAFGTYALTAAGSHALAPWLGGIIGKRMAKSRLESEARLAERDGKR